MTKANRQGRSIKQKYAECNKGKQSMSIGEFLEKRELRRSFFSRCVDGIVSVCVNDVWLSLADFNKLYPKLSVPHFNHDVTNCDKTKKWMYE